MIINETDIMMDLTGQPIPLASGAESLVNRSGLPDAGYT